MTQRLLVEFDKAGAEWCVVAFASGDGRMISVVESGESPHPITGNYISRVPVPLILREDKLLKHSTDPAEIEEVRREHLPELFTADYFLPRNMTIRQAGKKANHGLNYIEGPNVFAETSEMDISDAKRIHHMYSQEVYTGLPIWWASINRQLKESRTLYNCFGRKRRFYDPLGNELLKKGVAYIPQSTVVDVVNGAMISAYNDDEMQKTWDLLMQVHDSIASQVIVSDWKRFASQVIKIGLDYMNPELEYSGRKFRIGTDCKIGIAGMGHLAEVKLHRDVDKLAKELRLATEHLQKAA